MATAVQALSWAERLRAVGLRVTQPRLAVLDVVHTDPHLSADQVAERVRAGIGAVSTQAIYDALNTLDRAQHPAPVRAGRVGHEVRGGHRRQPPSPGLSHLRHGDRRAVRGRVDAVRHSRGHHGYLVEEAEVTYWGTCPPVPVPERPPETLSIDNSSARPAEQTSSQQPPTEGVVHDRGQATTRDGDISPVVSTTDNGAPAPSDQFSLTVGSDGPILLHDFHFLGQMAHFNRERVPERNVHAKGGRGVRRLRDHRGRQRATPRPPSSSPERRPRCWRASPPWPASRVRPTRCATRAGSR